LYTLIVRRWLLFAAALACSAQEPAPIRLDVNAVTVAVSVSDHDGAPVKNLRREDFTILDNHQPRQIESFWQETDLPLTIGLIADISSSQDGVIDKHRGTITRFLSQVMGPRDRAFLVTVSNKKVKLVTDLTGSIQDLRTGVEKIGRKPSIGIEFGESCHGVSRGCGTPLWDGVYSAARLKMKLVTGRKALIVLSDGQDVGSDHSLTDAIEAAQSADSLVYTIQYFGWQAQVNPLLKLRGGKPMRRLSAETGARAYTEPKDPGSVFTEIENDLRNLYVLGFTPPNEARDGKFHDLEVKVPKLDVVIRARKGYTAPRIAPAIQ
jgi:VWFA-related protein